MCQYVCIEGKPPAGPVKWLISRFLRYAALAIYSSVQRYPPAAAEACRKYSRLLRVANERLTQLALRKADDRNIDNCLLTTLLMGRFEGITCRPPDFEHVATKNSFASVQNWAYHDGAMAILKIWSDSTEQNRTTPIIRQTRREVIRSCLLRNRWVPHWMLNGSDFGEHGLELDFDLLTVRLINLHHEFSKLEQIGDVDSSKVEEFEIILQQLDESLQGWATRISIPCHHHQHVLEDLEPRFKKHFYSSIVYSYSRPEYALVWNRYFAVRLLSCSIRLRLLQSRRLSDSRSAIPVQQQLDCTSQLRALADDLAATIPFCLERFKVEDHCPRNDSKKISLNTEEIIKPYLATLAVWSMTIGASIAGLDMRQQMWFRAELAMLGRILGDGVLGCAETNQWVLF